MNDLLIRYIYSASFAQMLIAGAGTLTLGSPWRMSARVLCRTKTLCTV